MDNLTKKIENLKKKIQDEASHSDFNNLINLFKCLNSNQNVWKTK